MEATKNLTVTSKERNEIFKEYSQEKLNILKETNNLRRRKLEALEEQTSLKKKKLEATKEQNKILQNIATLLKNILEK